MREVETGDLRVGRRSIRTDSPVEFLMRFLMINLGTFQRDGPHETLEGKGRWRDRYHFMQSPHLQMRNFNPRQT